MRMYLSRHSLIQLGSRLRRNLFHTHLPFLEILVVVLPFGKPMLDEVSESAENARGVVFDVNINE
jgi:hypothetical protein